MSIKIASQDQLEKQNGNPSIIHKIPLVLYPNPKTLYAQRAQRMQDLAKDSPFSDYLQFCAKIVLAQAELIKSAPITEDLTLLVKTAEEKNLAPLSIENHVISEQFIDYLYFIMDAVSEVNDTITQTLATLKQHSKKTLMNKALQLRLGEFESISSNEAVFIWSALAIYYSQLASQIPGKAIAQMGEQRWLCPICHSAPTASVVHLGNNSGLRYLHCSLCESQWHVPRIKCTNCDNIENLTYYSLENELAAIKTECCTQCNGYLKIFSQEQDPHLDIVADDIHSLALDMETEKKHFAKSGLNPLLFPNQ